MTVAIQIGIGVILGGEQLAENRQVTGKQANVRRVSVAAAKIGTLTVRTDNDTGTATLVTGHGITTGARVDVYWSGGSRRGMTVGTVATNDVPIDGGSGDNLPVITTALKVAIAQEELFAFSGDSIVALMVQSPQQGRATFVLASGSTTEELYRVLQAGSLYHWFTGNGDTNPVAGDTITKVFFSHEFTTAQDMVIGILEN